MGMTFDDGAREIVRIVGCWREDCKPDVRRVISLVREYYYPPGLPAGAAQACNGDDLSIAIYLLQILAGWHAISTRNNKDISHGTTTKESALSRD